MSPESSPRPLKRDRVTFDLNYSQWSSQLPEPDQTFTVPHLPLSLTAADVSMGDTKYRAEESSRQPVYISVESQLRNEAPSTHDSSIPTEFRSAMKIEPHLDPPSNEMPAPSQVGVKREASPARSSTGELTDPGSDTPSRGTTPIGGTMAPPQSSAFAALNGNGSGPPPAKRAKLTFEEKEMKRINKEIKDRERAEEKTKKDAERQALAEEKARKDAGKEAEKKKREAEREEKRLALEADKAAKEERRKKKEEEKQRKDKGQMKLNNFFAMPATPAQPRNRSASVESRGRSSISPAPQKNLADMLTASAPSPFKRTPSKAQLSDYDKMFPAFFIQNGVTLAPMNRFERDAEASKVLETTIDNYFIEGRSRDKQQPFDAISLFHISEHDIKPRGLRRMPVREIMTEFFSGNPSKPIDLTVDSQNSQIKRTTDLLQKVPMKFLQFQEDVRPPYRGTYTARPRNGFTKLARNPMRKDLPDMNYDYDSEAEWVEDDDAEDLKSEDEEEELDDDEDMDGFLDDDGDETSQAKRLVLQGDLEPISTGLCWEDRTKRSTNVKMVAYRMEIILDPTIKAIDPFSTSYWEPQTSSMDPPRIPLNNMRNTSLNFNGSATKPVKSFFNTTSDAMKSASSPQTPTANSKAKISKPKDPKPKDSKPKELLSFDKMEAFKQEIQANIELTKVGLVEVLRVKFRGHTASTIKATLDAVATRGTGKHPKWVLREDAEVAARMS